MTNRNYSTPNKSLHHYRSNTLLNENERYRLPAINNAPPETSNMNSESMTRSFVPQATLINTAEHNPANTTYSSSNYSSFRPGNYDVRTSSYSTYKSAEPPRGVASSQTFSSLPPSSGMYNSMQQVPMNRTWSSNRLGNFEKANATNTELNKNSLGNQNHSSPPLPSRPMTSAPPGFDYPSLNLKMTNGQKTIVRDRRLANEILQKAGISTNLPGKDCIEVITDAPVTLHDNVNCDPNPLCMKKPADNQEFYEQSIVVRHLHPPKPPVPAPIIIREHCTQPLPAPQPPIVIRQIPPRPPTPPPLIIRECPPPMPDLQEPTIIDREVPPPPPPPRQVIVERLPTPPSKPRSIILEKWLPFEEPKDRPCIVEKVTGSDLPPPKNVIIHYEAREPRIEPQCVDEGISYVDPKQFVNDKPKGNVEVCYIDQLNNLPDHIKSQLGPQVLAAIGIPTGNKSAHMTNPPHVLRTNPPVFCPQQDRIPHPYTSTPIRPRCAMNPSGYFPSKTSYAQQGTPNVCRQQYQQATSGTRALSAAAAGLPHCYNKYNTSMLARTGNQGVNHLARGFYNPWATTYQVSYNNKGRGMCRAR